MAIPTRGCLGGNQRVVGHREVGEGDDACTGNVVVLEADHRAEERPERHPHLGRFRPVDSDLDLEVIEILLGKHEPQLPQASGPGDVEDVDGAFGRGGDVGGRATGSKLRRQLEEGHGGIGIGPWKRIVDRRAALPLGAGRRLDSLLRPAVLGRCVRGGQQKAERYAPEDADQRSACGVTHRAIPLLKV